MSSTGNGLLGQYFDNADLTNLKLSRTDSTISFDWLTGAPASSINSDTFSVRWTGQIEPLYNERYTFYTTSDDGVRLWVNNQLVIDRWVNQSSAETYGSIDLIAGRKYDIRLEYYENAGNADVALAWSSASQPKQNIPKSQLYSNNTATSTTSTTSIFPPSTTPSQIVTDGSGSAGDYELGTEFKSLTAGQIQAIRYYKAPGETGIHIGRIWSSTGQLLGSVTFNNETASGWQQQTLPVPITIAGNTSYIVSVNNNTYYAMTQQGLATPVANGDLSAIKGLYNPTPGLAPTQTWNNSNYFRDVVFSANTLPVTGPQGVLAFSAATFSVNESGTPVAAVTITRTGGSTGSVSATITLENGTAKAPADYSSNPIVVTFAGGDTTAKTITIPIVNDTLDENNETINLILGSPTGGATIGTQSTAVLTVVDNDPQPTVNLGPATASKNEGNSGSTTFNFTVSLSSPSGRRVTIPYTTNNGTAIAGFDYIDNDGSLIFNPGETSKTINVQVNGDTTVEPNETFTLQLGTPTNATLGTTTQSTATIVNDDVSNPTPSGSYGLLAQYFDNSNFSNLKLTRVDPTINFSWGGGSPDSSIAPDNDFSVRWSGVIKPLYSEQYTFSSIAGGLNRVWIDNELVNAIDYVNVPGVNPSITLEAGREYKIRVEGINGGYSQFQLFWQSASQPKQIIPQSQLYSIDAFAPTAKLNASNFTSNGQSNYDFKVNYHDSTAVDIATLSSSNIQVSGPNGFNQAAILMGVNLNSSGMNRTATYRITAPGSAWDSADNGTYTITLQPNRVSDTLGNTLTTATTLGTFNFNANFPALPGLSNIPKPSSNPGLPTGADTFTPSFNGTVSSESPIISEWTKSGQPGDTIVLSGWKFTQLTGSQLGSDTKFWVYGQTESGNGVLAEAKTQSLSGDVASITLPTNLPKGSDYIVWAQNNSGVSKPVLINDTEAWWIGPNAATRGNVTSIFGRNLSQDGGTSNTNVYIENSTGQGYWAQVVAVNPYKVDFVVPQGLANGNYKAWVHNGDGGLYGWSDPLVLTVNDGIKYTGGTFNVKNYGAKGDGVTNDTQAIRNAMNAAHQSGMGTVYLPSGIYILSDTIEVFAGNDNILFMGDGKDNTSIKAANSFSKPQMFVTSGASEKVTFQDLTLDANFKNTTVTSFRYSSDIQYLNVRIKAQGPGSPFDWHANTRTFMKNSEVIGKQGFLGSTSQTFIDRTTFYATGNDTAALTAFGTDELSVTNSIAKNFDPSTSDGWGGGRLFVDQPFWGNPKNQYFGNNQTVDLSPSPTNWNQNAGEQILWETESAEFPGAVSSSTTSTISFSTIVSPLDSNWHLTIVGGKGIGQSRQIASFNQATKTYTVDDVWNVLPDSSSIVVANKMPSQAVVYGNTLDGLASQAATTAATGVQTYHGADNLIVDKNTFTDLGAGIKLFSGYSDFLAPVHFAQVTNNNFKDDINGIGFIYTPNSGLDGTVYIGNIVRNNYFDRIDESGIYLGLTRGGSLPSANTNVFETNTLGTIGQRFMSLPDELGTIQKNIISQNSFL